MAWIEVAAGKKKWAPGEQSAEDQAIGSERLRAMLEARRAPIASIWEPKRTIGVVGHEVATKREWEAIKKERGIIEVSPRDSAVRDVKAKPKFDARAAAQQSMEHALALKQKGELPPLPPPPTTPKAPDKRAILTPQEAAQADPHDVPEGTSERPNPIHGERADSQEDAVAAMMNRLRQAGRI